MVAQQSYLDWIDGGESPLEPGSDRVERRFKELALLIARFLNLDSKKLRDALAQFSVYTAGDLSFIRTLPARGFTPKEIRQIEWQILSRESYFIPRANAAYLANLSVNHAAEEAAHFLRHISSGAGDEPRPLLDGFYARALEEAFAFFGSKIRQPAPQVRSRSGLAAPPAQGPRRLHPRRGAHGPAPPAHRARRDAQDRRCATSTPAPAPSCSTR